MRLLVCLINYVVEVGTKMILSQYHPLYVVWSRVGRCSVSVMFWSLHKNFITLRI